ncbi:unnamed protein product [Prunus armeniaca]
MSTLINGVNLILVLSDVSLLVTLLLIRVISAHLPIQKVHVTLDVTFHEEVPYNVSLSSPIQGERRSELESLALENDVFEKIALGKETTCRTEASDRSPIFEDETCGLCKETTDRPLELNRLPISGDEASALDVETTENTEASDQSCI